MENFFSFFLLLFAAIFFPTIFRSLHLPWVVALILGGIIIGPHVLDFFEPNEIFSFLGQIGLVFLMFIAGLETRLGNFRKSRRGVFSISIINGFVPFVVGVSIGYLFGFGFIPSLFLGVIFISSSIAVIIPSLEATGLLGTRLGRSIVSATIVEDVISLVLLSILLQTVNPITTLPLPIFYFLLFATLVILRRFLPKIERAFAARVDGASDKFELELRTIFVALVGTVVAFEFLGLHPIIAGFFAGFVLADTINTDIMRERLRALSYGFFIPVFFVIVGAETDIGVFFGVPEALFLVLAIIVGSIGSKFASGWLGGKIAGFSSRESFLVGAATIPQLSTTLAVAFSAVELGFLRAELVTAMVMLSIVTTIVGPLLIRFFAHGIRKNNTSVVQ